MFRVTCAYRPRADVREGTFVKMFVKMFVKGVRNVCAHQEAREKGAIEAFYATLPKNKRITKQTTSSLS